MIYLPPQNLEQQKFEGLYDTNQCWNFSGEDWLESGLEALWSIMPDTHKNFCIQNNLSDANGIFALSRRWIAILSGVTNHGNYQLDYWTGADYSVDTVGIIPRSLLDFTPVGIQDPTYNAFISDFFNPSVITQQMRNLGKEFLTYFNITAKNVPSSPSVSQERSL